MKFTERLDIPYKIGRYRFNVQTEIIRGDILWLIGRDTMGSMNMKVDLGDKIIIIGALGI